MYEVQDGLVFPAVIFSGTGMTWPGFCSPYIHSAARMAAVIMHDIAWFLLPKIHSAARMAAVIMLL